MSQCESRPPWGKVDGLGGMYTVQSGESALSKARKVDNPKRHKVVYGSGPLKKRKWAVHKNET